MKKLIAVVIILSTALSLCGCMKSMQLNERALVQAIGIDFEDDMYKLTFQLFSPATEGGINISASSENAKIIEASGKTITEAIQNATLVQGKQIFIGHNRLIVLGKSLVENGIPEGLSYFSSNPSTRKNAHIAMTTDKASDILKAKINQGVLPAEALEKIILNASDGGFVEEVQLFSLLRMLKNKHESALLPIMELKKGEEGSGGGGGGEGSGDKGAGGGGGEGSSKQSKELDAVSSIEFKGTGVITNGKLACELPKELSRGLLWIRNSVKQTIVVASTDKFDVAGVELHHIRTKIIPEYTKDNIIFHLKINCQGMLNETKIHEGQYANLNDIRAVQQAVEQLISKECTDTFKAVVKDSKSDALNFGNIVARDNVKFWRTVYENWADELDKIELKVDAKVDIDRFGLDFLHTEI